MMISTDETKVTGFKGKIPIRIKIVVNEWNLEQALNFNYSDFNMGSDKEMDINVQLQRCQVNKYIVQILTPWLVMLGGRHY
jgi:hypothetical protein